jgi:hypothetical protein
MGMDECININLLSLLESELMMILDIIQIAELMKLSNVPNVDMSLR